MRPNFVNRWWSWFELGANPANLPRSLVVTTPASAHGYVKPMRMCQVVAELMRH